jgi:hypothetical protein
MRKEDRIRQEQNSSDQQRESAAQPRKQERVKGSATDHPTKPQRQSGKLPLPD